ncbi:MAG: putative glycoside hydrolase, partial [Oscillospiraceae bacterium]|nr:putative glycoside hydrolase [Oscillospiraceae bacterium]
GFTIKGRYFGGDGPEGGGLADASGGTGTQATSQTPGGTDAGSPATDALGTGDGGDDPGDGGDGDTEGSGWDGGYATTKINKPQFDGLKVKAIYLTGSTVANHLRFTGFIDMVNETELNAVVIDLRESTGVEYRSRLESVVEYGDRVVKYDIEEVVGRLNENGIYVIGRLVCFQSILAGVKGEWAIKDEDEVTVWKDVSGAYWLNPYNRDVWEYLLDIAEEAVLLGVDEIQFDYVRFPTPSVTKVLYYGKDVPSKEEAIEGFLLRAKERITETYGIPVSADVYGIIIESDLDAGLVGQKLEYIGRDGIILCPMIYPSHYANEKSNGYGQAVNGVLFKAPDLEPYKLIYNVLLKMRSRSLSIDGFNSTIRPYLQAFTASYLAEGYWQAYTPSVIREQIQAVYDAGYEEWILWDHNNNYKRDTFMPPVES